MFDQRLAGLRAIVGDDVDGAGGKAGFENELA